MAKRVSSSSVNWSFLSTYLKGPSFNTFKGKTDKFLRMVVSQPSELPKIEWSYYKNNIAAAEIVDSFQKSYDTLKIPYPSDQGWLAKVDADETKNLKTAEEILSKTNQQINEFTAKLKELESHIPYSEMSIEEFMMARPEYRFDPDKPKLWPQFVDTHIPDDVKPEPSDH